MQWKWRIFVDNALLFVLFSTPEIFTAIADALQWVIKQCRVAKVHHNLDDFITLGEPDQATCARNLQVIIQMCEQLGITVGMDKCAGPIVCLTFLGIEIDNMAMEMQLPAEKCTKLQDTLCKWRGCKACTKRELLSLTRQLGHACKVVHCIKAGQIFLRQMIKLLTVVKKLSGSIGHFKQFWSGGLHSSHNGMEYHSYGMRSSHQSPLRLMHRAAGAVECFGLHTGSSYHGSNHPTST